MDKRILILITVLLTAAVFLRWVSMTRNPSEPTHVESPPVVVYKTSAPEPVTERKDDRPRTTAQLPATASGKYDPTLPQWQEWRQRNKEDPKWEWKTPIAFYGRVLDQNNNPVVGAKVILSWTDLSAKGTSLRELQTDGAGNFTLSGVTGKHLSVRSIEKAGYKNSTTNRDGFEYSAFFEEEYHIPDPNNPVIFRLYQNATAEPLIKLSNKVEIPPSGSVGVNLQNGHKGAVEAHVMIEFVDNSDPSGKKWGVRLRAPGGGIQTANEEFATVAPESGYQSEIYLDQDTHQPSGFQSGSLYKGGKFYVKTSAGYAVFDFRMIPGSSHFKFSSYLNPNLNSRNLEYDPAKQSNPR